MAKWGKSDIDWGSASNVEEKEDQVWQLTPRYKVSIQPVVIWSVDNRHGSLDFWEEVTINEGWLLKASTEKRFSKNSLEAALKSALSRQLEEDDALYSNVCFQIEKLLMSSNEKECSHSSKMLLTAPKRKNYRVKQTHINFEGTLEGDNFIQTTFFKVEETDGDFD